MNIRNLVPALAIVTLTSTAGFAADAAPAVTFSGWVDTVLQFSDDDTKNVAPSGKDDGAGSLRFTGAANLKAAWKVTDKVSAKTNLWFDPGSNSVNMREAYFTWALSSSISWSMGKMISDIGWMPADPTDATYLFINENTIGYADLKLNDTLGTALRYESKDSPISGAIHITNGYFTRSDAISTNYTSTNSGTRENSDLGFGLDVTFKLPDNLGSINAELAYDIHSGDTAYLGGPTPVANVDLGGDVLLVGINATIKPTKILTFAGEVQYLTIGDSKNNLGVSPTPGNGINRLQFMVLGNVVIEAAPVPMSVTGMVHYITISGDADRSTTVAGINKEDENRLFVGVTLLTNPVTNSNFGLNFEVGYWDKTGINGVAGSAGENNGLTVAVEGLISF